MPDAKKVTRPLVSVKIDADVYRLIRTVAAWRGENIADYLSESMLPIAKRDVAKINKAGSAAADAG
jgi:uncharacterized protein (DUF1778 family)